MKAAVIGGGPVGCYVGYLLASKGWNVLIFENHLQIGKPIQCTGLLTGDFDLLGVPKEEFLVNTIDRIEVFSPHRSAAITQREYIVCRYKFDNYLARMAEKAGADIKVGHSFMRREGDSLIIRRRQQGDEMAVKADIVIAADGPLSPTARAFGFYEQKRKNYYGLQAIVKGRFESQAFQVYFGRDVCPGLFAWVVPESNTRARVGVACLRDSKKYFESFMKKIGLDKDNVVEMQAGTIPIYDPAQRMMHENCYVVGDAAGFVKATTLGGIVPGLRQARILASCLNGEGDYEKGLRGLRRELKMHLDMHNVLERFCDDDWDRLVGYMSQKRIQKVLTRHTRENPLPIVLKSLLMEPRLLYFVKYKWSSSNRENSASETGAMYSEKQNIVLNRDK